MTEITRVPIQPVAKGSLTKLWIGVLIAVLIGAALAFSAIPKGLSIETRVEGAGPTAQVGDWVFVKYTGKLASTGETFDESQELPPQIRARIGDIFPEGIPFPVEQGQTVEGFFQGLQQMQAGGEYTLFIPAELGYGAEPPQGAPIPPNADLIFDIEVVDIMSNETYERNMAIIQQMMAGPGGPNGADAPPPGL